MKLTLLEGNSAMSEELKDLITKKFGTLEPAEEKFFQAVIQRRTADFSAKADDENDPEKAGKWKKERVLKARRIVEFLTCPEAISSVPPDGIEVRGARIDGDLNLSSIKIPFPLIFKRCAFSGDINLKNCKIWVLDFCGSHVRSIDCTGSKVDKGIFLSDGFRSNGIVCIEGTKIGGPLDCTGAEFLNPGNTALDADGIKVAGDVLMHNGFRAEGMVSLVEATITGNLECNQGLFINKGGVALNAERLKVSGDVFLCKGSWPRGKEIQAEGFRAEGEVKLVGAGIGGTLECRGGIFKHSNAQEPALNVTRGKVDGNVLLHNGFRAEGMVGLVGTKIKGNLECNQGVFINKGKVAINAERIKVDGDVFLCEGFWGSDEEVEDGFSADGEVKLVGAIIGGTLECRGGIFHNSGSQDPALNAKGLKVGGNVLLGNGVVAEGGVVLLSATIAGNLECKKGEFRNKGKVALDAERVKVGGDVFLCEESWGEGENLPVKGFASEGEVRLVRAVITGDLNCIGGRFCNPKNKRAEDKKEKSAALKANGLKINGSVFLSEGFRADGKVDLIDATIGGNLECNCGEFVNRADVALDAERLKVNGNIFMCEGCWQRKIPIEVRTFKAVGEVKLIGAVVGGSVDCKGASFAGDEPKFTSKVSLNGATINRELVWTKIVSPEQAKLNLQFARVVKISDDEKSWPGPGNLFLNGLVYDEIDFDTDQTPQTGVSRFSLRWFWGFLVTLCKQLVVPFRGDIEKVARIKWLELQDKFYHQPYEQLVSVLRKNGRNKDARTVLIAKARDRTKLMSLFGKCWNSFLGATIGYGYRPWRALLISAVVVAIGTAIFWAGHNRKIIKETKVVEHVFAAGKSVTPKVHPDYPEFNALVYSLDMFVPLVDLRQAKYWLPSAKPAADANAKSSADISAEPSAEPAKGLDDFVESKVPLSVKLLRCYTLIHIILGWILTTLLFAGLGGLVKR